MKTTSADIERTKVTKQLTFKLTTEEFAAKGKEAAQFKRELTELEMDFEHLKRVWKGKIENKQSELNTVLKLIREAKEERTVDCIMVKDYDRHLVQYEYEGVVMEERPMELRERQAELVVPARSPVGLHHEEAVAPN